MKNKNLLPLLLIILTLPIGQLIYHHTSDSIKLHSISDQLFEQALLDNTINLHYTLAEPETYGLEDYSVSLGSYSVSEFRDQSLVAENALHALSNVSYSDLNEEDALTYDVLSYHLKQQLRESDFPLYSEPLSSHGVLMELPILLAEYTFRSEQDIQDYLHLLECMPPYFKELETYEIEKANAGLFMSDRSLDLVLANCKTIMDNHDRHFLQISFEDRINALSSITKAKRQHYLDQHRHIMQNTFFPSYYDLYQTLSSLRGSGQNPYGLCCFENGKAYYEHLVVASTGTSYSPTKLKQILLKQLKQDYTELADLLQNNPSLSDMVSDIRPIASSSKEMLTPESMLADLLQKTQKDFPLPTRTTSDDVFSYRVKYVDDSLEAFMSPAFYLTPPIDLLSENTIYINNVSSFSKIELFTTLAHEGYPGHMLQNTYYLSLDPPPIRTMLYFGAYSEGWAVYTEQYAYTLTDLDEDLIRVLQLDHSLQLCICSLLDIMIHYEGLTPHALAEYISNLGPSIDEDALMNVYQSIVDEPTNYLKYYVGFLEICRLRERAEKALGNRFSEKDFHEFLLSIGPAPFSIIEKREDIWIQTVLSFQTAMCSQPFTNSSSSCGTFSSIVSLWN